MSARRSRECMHKSSLGPQHSTGGTVIAEFCYVLGGSLLSLSRFRAGTASPVLASSRCPSAEPGSVVPERSFRLADSLLRRVRGGPARPPGAGPGSGGLPGMCCAPAPGGGLELAANAHVLMWPTSRDRCMHVSRSAAVTRPCRP